MLLSHLFIQVRARKSVSDHEKSSIVGSFFKLCSSINGKVKNFLRACGLMPAQEVFQPIVVDEYQKQFDAALTEAKARLETYNNKYKKQVQQNNNEKVTSYTVINKEIEKSKNDENLEIMGFIPNEKETSSTNIMVRDKDPNLAFSAGDDNTSYANYWREYYKGLNERKQRGPNKVLNPVELRQAKEEAKERARWDRGYLVIKAEPIPPIDYNKKSKLSLLIEAQKAPANSKSNQGSSSPIRTITIGGSRQRSGHRGHNFSK